MEIKQHDGYSDVYSTTTLSLDDISGMTHIGSPFIGDSVIISPNSVGIEYKYGEQEALAKIQQYVKSTYGQHYAGNKQIQVFDVWESLGSLETTARDTAIKYLSRYGKKDGKNEKDLLKAIHYIILMMYCNKGE